VQFHRVGIHLCYFYVLSFFLPLEIGVLITLCNNRYIKNIKYYRVPVNVHKMFQHYQNFKGPWIVLFCTKICAPYLKKPKFFDQISDKRDVC
jgi:hypothetical protein